MLERLAARVRNIRRALGETHDGARTGRHAAGSWCPWDTRTRDARRSAGCSRRQKMAAPRPGRTPRLRVAGRGAAAGERGRSTDTHRTPAGDHLPLAFVRRAPARTSRAWHPASCSGSVSRHAPPTGSPAASAVVVIHVALAPAALSRTRPSTLLAALASARGAQPRCGRVPRPWPRPSHAHHLYTARATAREAALRAAAAGDDDGAGCPCSRAFSTDERCTMPHNNARAREHRFELHTARLARIALEAQVDERLSVEPILALVLR